MSVLEGKLKEDFLQFSEELRQKKMIKSFSLAHTTVSLLKEIVCLQDKWKVAKNLMDIISREGRQLMAAQPSDTVVGNMIKRVLKIIREDYEEKKFRREISDAEREKDGYSTELPELRDMITDSVTELLEELSQSAHSIACEALNHIHSNDVVMTVGQSHTVELFLKVNAKCVFSPRDLYMNNLLKEAAKKRKFQVVVAECAPFYYGHELAVSLAKDSIETTVIADSATFAMMSRVNKVIIGTHTVLANGGLKSVSGSYALALAAKHYSVPLIVCTAVYKLSPQYLCSVDQDQFNKFMSPHDVIKFSDGGKAFNDSHVYNPVFDYVPPELVTLFIFNIGGNAPSYIYRLLSEMYHLDDYNLENNNNSDDSS